MVQVLVHVEAASGSGLVWWAESPDVPGFSAAADTLAELRFRVKDALRDIVSEEGDDPRALEVAFVLAEDAPSNTNIASEVTFSGPPEYPAESNSEAPGRARSATVLQAA